MIRKILRVLSSALFFIILFVIATFLIFILFFISEDVNTENEAFLSDEIAALKPRPDPGDPSISDGFDKLLEANRDAVGWLTVYDTVIDYPVVQGSDDLEYVSKDFLGNRSLSGAIFLSSKADGFRDYISVIYGHHMEGGAMFGGLEMYKDQKYFDSHAEGALQTEGCNLRLSMLALIKADAYEKLIYKNRDGDHRKELTDYIIDNAYIMSDDAEEKLSDAEKLIFLSTCEDAGGPGRMVLICEAAPGEIEYKPTDAAPDKSKGWSPISLFSIIILILLTIDAGISLFSSGEKKKSRIFAFSFNILLLISAVFIFLSFEDISGLVYINCSDTVVMLIMALAGYLSGGHFVRSKKPRLDI